MEIKPEKLKAMFAFPHNLSVIILKDKKKSMFGFNLFVNKGQKTEVSIKIKPIFPRRQLVVTHIDDILNCAVSLNEQIVGEEDIFFLDKQMIGFIVNKLQTQDEFQTS